MSGVLARYLRRRVAIQTFALLLVLTALMQVLEMLDVTTEILDRNLGVEGLFRYAMLRTPSEVVVALPLAALLGAMSSFYAMARTQEITAIRCAGISLRSLAVLLLPVPLMFGVLHFSVSEWLVPKSEATLKIWWDATAPEDEAIAPTWVHTRAGPVAFDRASTDGRHLIGVRIYGKDEQGLLATRQLAREAVWDGQGWQLLGVQTLSVNGQAPSRSEAGAQPWLINLRPDDVTRLDVQEPHLSSIVLAGLIAGERAGSQPRSYYRTVLYRSFTLPLTALVMLLLALPCTRASSRSGGGAVLLVSLGLGLAFLLCDGIASALGTSGRISAQMAALFSTLLFAGIGFLRLKFADRA